MLQGHYRISKQLTYHRSSCLFNAQTVEVSSPFEVILVTLKQTVRFICLPYSPHGEMEPMMKVHIVRKLTGKQFIKTSVQLMG